jgi:hypothetical protein
MIVVGRQVQFVRHSPVVMISPLVRNLVLGDGNDAIIDVRLD